MEVALAKPVKCNNNFVAKSSGLSIAKKATTTTIKIAGKKMHSTSVGGSGAI
jgi:hypothetical protein